MCQFSGLTAATDELYPLSDSAYRPTQRHVHWPSVTAGVGHAASAVPVGTALINTQPAESKPPVVTHPATQPPSHPECFAVAPRKAAC